MNRKKIDFYSYIIKHAFIRRYFSWKYIKSHVWDAIFTGISIIVFAVTLAINVSKAINHPIYKSFSLRAVIEALLNYSIGLMLIAFFSLVLKLRPLYKSWRKDKAELVNAEIDIEEEYPNITLEEDYIIENHSYTRKIKGQKAVFSSQIYYSINTNRYLIENNNLKIKTENNKDKQKDVEDFITDNFEKLKLFLKIKYKGSATLFNEDKLCLASDIKPGIKTVKLYKGTYFDTMLTNDIAGKCIKDKNEGDETINRHAIVKLPLRTSEDGSCCQIKSVADTLYNNQMGGSTIAFTSDNYFVFWIQNGLAQHSNGLIAPTGSGSCDYADLVEGDFIRSIKNTMERELLEESTKALGFSNELDYSQIQETKLIGYFRWLDRGALPQFVGVTKLKVPKSRLVPNKKETIGNKLNDELFKPIENNTLIEIQEYLEEKKDSVKLSVPLYYNIITLLDFIKNYPEEAERFFFQATD